MSVDGGSEKDTPLVSVVIPVYNGERYLGEAIESVLAQSYEPVEVIVVDDASTDGSAEVAQSFGARVRYFRQERAGAAAARNFGVREARGSLIAFLDADDLWSPEKLSLQVTALQEDTRRDMVFGHVRQFHSPELAAEGENPPSPPDEMMAGCFPGTLLIGKEAFLRVGFFASNWRIAEFIDWYARAKEEGLETFVLPEVVTLRRIHSSNTGIRERDARGDFARVLKAALDRRRRRQQDDKSIEGFH